MRNFAGTVTADRDPQNGWGKSSENIIPVDQPWPKSSRAQGRTSSLTPTETTFPIQHLPGRLIEPAPQHVLHVASDDGLAICPFPNLPLGPQFPLNRIRRRNVGRRTVKLDGWEMRLRQCVKFAQLGLNVCDLFLEGLILFLRVSELVGGGR